MAPINKFFFGEESISLSDASFFYGTYAATAAIAIYTMFQIYKLEVRRMGPTEYERQLQKLMNNLQMVLLDGKSIFDEGYAADVRNRVLKAERALEALKNELKNGEK